MTPQDLQQWEEFYTQYKNGYHLSSWDWMNFVRLNHEFMLQTHEIHNKSMEDLK